MQRKKHSLKCGVCVILTLAMLICMVLCTTAQFGAWSADMAVTSADTYYLWGVNNNDAKFSTLSSPTGTFTYDNSKGYYYCDIESFSGGDYCFIVSTSSSSGSAAYGSQATTTVASGASYYLVYGSYGGNSCFHIWNDKRESVRLYFTTISSGINAMPKSSSDATVTPATTAPTTATTPTTTPTQGGATTPSTGDLIYCKNTAGWSSVYAYMWKDNVGNNGGWPGQPMTNIGDDIWQYEVTGDYDMIIFNAGSSGTQTTNLNYPGNGYIYDNSTGAWSIYDTSPLQVKSFTTTLKSPQYKGTDIELTAEATGIGTVSYKFSVTNSSGNTTVISDYSTASAAIWTPDSTGTYTITYDFKDTVNNKNQRTLTYVITDDTGVVKPILKSVTPKPGQILKGTQQNFTVTASGGNTGTNLLFYKYTIKDSGGNIVNVPYYTKSNTYKFTPSAVGTYTVTISVQGSDNDTAERTYTYYSVTEITDDPLPTTPTSSTTETTPTNSVATIPTTVPSDKFTLKGDSDMDGDVSIIDATQIQRVLAKLAPESSINTANADTDADGKISILDATMIQRFLAKLVTNW